MVNNMYTVTIHEHNCGFPTPNIKGELAAFQDHLNYTKQQGILRLLFMWLSVK